MQATPGAQPPVSGGGSITIGRPLQRRGLAAGARHVARIALAVGRIDRVVEAQARRAGRDVGGVEVVRGGIGEHGVVRQRQQRDLVVVALGGVERLVRLGQHALVRARR